MYDLFRFILSRPPQQLDDSKSIRTDTNTDFHAKVLGAQGRTRRKEVATEFLHSAKFVKGYDDLANGDAYKAAAAAIVPGISAANAKKAITDAFGGEPKAIVEREPFKTNRDRLADSLVAAKLVSRGDEAQLDEVQKAFRITALIERFARDDAALNQPGAIDEALARRIRLPATLFEANASSTPATRPPSVPAQSDHVTKLEAKANGLHMAIRALASFGPNDFTGAQPQLSRGSPAMVIHDDTHDEWLNRLREVVAPGLPDRLAQGRGSVADPPIESPVHPLTVTAKALDRLPSQVRTVVQERGIDLERLPLPQAVAQLEAEMEDTGQALATAQTTSALAVSGIGNTFMILPPAGVSFLSGAPINGALPQPSLSALAEIKPSGTGDLLVVKQQIKRYEAGEVGHIENVLKGEFSEHSVRRARTTEVSQVDETERTQEEERDLQSTEHFELKSEIDKTVKEDASLKAGASISGSYGGMIDFKAYVDGALSTSTQESTKQSSAYAKDVTTRSANKVSERIRQQITRKMVEEFEDSTKHGINNSAGAGHVIGVYQWADKIYEAQVWNYGVRLLFDFMVPEPAAFFINALAAQKVEGTALDKPVPFTLSPGQLNEWNYQYYVGLYGATGIDPPPPMYRTVVKTFDERSDNANPKTKVAELALEAGYRALSGVAQYRYAWRSSDFWTGSPSVAILIGDRSLPTGGYTPLSNEEGQISVGIFGYKISDITATIEVLTQRTDTKLNDWRLKTFAAIQQAYLKQESDYEQKLAALKAQVAGLQGHNPARNVSIEKAELKRSSLGILTQRAYEVFDAIDEASPGGGQPDLATVGTLGKYVRFFEQAFEWEQMMYVFYPYFWGRKGTWQQRLLLDDADPQFADFLQAGWARVTVPVRPWFEKAIAHYLETGEIWEGGDVPDVNSPLYVSILTEVEERLNRPGAETPQGDPWEVRLPTTLVRLRPDADLPKWKKQVDGTWAAEN